MSSPGINPLAIVAPDLYAQQIAIQRRQALAQSLLGQGEQAPGSSPYAGLRNAGNTILGAFLAKRGDQDMANLYSPLAGGGSSQPSPAMVSNTAQQVSPSPPADPSQAGSMPQVSNNPMPNQALGAALQGNSSPRTPATALGGAIPDLPGLSHQQSLIAYLQSPQAYWTAIAAAKGPTNEQKNANFAFPGDAQTQQSMVGAGLTKSGAIPVNRGVTYIPDGKGGYQPVYAPPVAPEGYQNQAGPNGQLQLAPVSGGLQAVAGSNMAKAAGSGSVTPFTGYNAEGMPQATNATAMSGNPAAQGLIPGQQQPLGIRNNNPGNLQPGGQEATYRTPSEGILKAASNLDNYAKQGINTLSGIISRWAPQSGGNNTAAYIQDASRRLGVDPNQPLNLQDPSVKGKVLDAIFTHENGRGAMAQMGAAAPQSLSPALPASQQTYMAGQGKDASDRHDATVAAASESPMRINVLDNIINLSKSGVATGPGQEFQNSILGYAANVPGLSKIMSGAKDNVGKFQELQKFTYQNAIRSWQAAGGTGTDAQMQSMAHANPNDHLFPQALQQIAQWGKAGELAVQGKANAQDAFLAQNGQTPTNQIKFENTWRNAFDPKVFQYSLMDPQQKQVFAQQELKTPQAAKAFLAKQQQLKQLGAIQ